MSPAEVFDWFADWADDTSPLYALLSRRIMDDEFLLDVASEVRDDQPPPHLLFAAVHARLLDGAETPLRDYYPSIVGDADRDPDERAFTLFRDFVESHEAGIRRVVSIRRTQTNAVRRCAALYPSFAHVAREAADRGEPDNLALLEIGPSAGLNLRWDDYRYEFGNVVVGHPDAPATINSRIEAGDPPLPDVPPKVTDRLGVDLNPLDVTNPEDETWLRALVWPEHTDRHDRLDQVIPVVRADSPEVVQGDAVELLPELVRRLPEDATRVVYNTHVLYQLGDDERETIREHIRELGREQPLYWVSGEGAYPEYEEGIELLITRASDGELDETFVGGYQQHGRWVVWKP